MAKILNRNFLLKLSAFLAVLFATAFFSPNSAEAAVRTSTATGGTWSVGSTWVGGVAPGNTDSAIIATTGGNSVNISANTTNAGVTVNSGAILNFTGAFTLTENGTATVNGTVNGATGIIKMNVNPSTIYGSGTINSTITVQQPTSIAATANITITGIITLGNTLTITSGGILNATEIDSNGKSVINNGTVNLTGNFLRTGGTAIWTQGTNAVVNITGAFTPSANITLNASASGNIVNYNGSSAQTANIATYYTFKSNNPAGVTLSGATTITNLTIGDIATNSIFNDGGFVITPGTGSVLSLISGTYNLGSATVGTSWPSWGTANISAGTTVGYVSGVAQTVSATPSYQNLTFSGTGAKTTAAGTISVGGSWSVSGGTATLSANNSNVTVAGNIIGTGSITSGTGTIALGGNWTNNGTFTKGAGTVTYNGSSAQTVAVLNYNNLILSGVGQKNAGGVISVGGNLTNSSVFDMAGNTLSVTGTNTNTGGTIRFSGTNNGLAVSTGTIEYYGSSQNITAGTYNNLKINQASGSATLGGTATVGGVLTLLSGNVVTSSNNLYINSTGSISRSSGQIVGNLRKYITTGATSKTFEVGDASNYTPAVISFGNVTVAGDLTISTTAGDDPNVGSSVFSSSLTVNRYWTLANSVTLPISFSNYSATFNFINPGDLDSGVNTSYFIIGRYSGSWSYPTMGTLTTTSSQATGLTAFGDFQIGQSNPVPTTTSISPSSKAVGDAQFTLTVNGTGFIPASTVLFGGITESTTYVSSTQLTAVIPTTDFPTAGNYNVRAFNPTPGGGQSNAQTFTVTSAVDATAPTVTAFTIPSTSSSLTVSVTTFTATDNVGVTGYLLTESATTPSSSDSGWAGTAPTSYVFSTAGSKTLYAWAKDAAGNISASLNASVTITLADNTAPAAVTDLAASNPTNSSIDLSWTAPGNDGNTGTAVSYDIRYSTSLITSANFSSATQATSIPAPQIAGTHQSMTVTSLFPATTYYFALETSDAVPNTSSISNVPTGSTTSIADTTPPVVTAFSIPSTSNSLTVPITAFTATDNVGVYKYLINESSSTPSVSDSGWSLTVPTSYIFSSGGSKTLYAWAKDAAGNISTSLNASVTITLPATTIITPSQIQSTISGGIIVPNNVLTSSSQVTFTQQVQINFTSGSIMTVPINTVMSTSTNEDFSQLGASSDLGSISVPVNYNFIGGLSFGLPSSSLTSTRDVSISIFAGTQYNGQTAVVFKKSYGDTDWSQISTCVISSGFCQFTSTGFSSFMACLPATQITSTGGSGIPPKNVIFSGRAFPGGKVKVYRRSPIEKILVNSTPPDYSIQVDDQGNFSQHFISFFESDYLFFLEGIDKNGIGSGMLTFTANLLSSNDLTVDNIFIPPTINVQNNSVTRGKNVKVTGYAYPGSSIQLRIDNVLIIKSVANDSGYYEATINTTSYSPKTHFIMAKQIDKSGVSSQYSASKNFTVSSLRYPQADFNGDNIIDIKDWSIFLSRWSGNATLRAFDDLNLDGKVDILDFSIFLKAMKGL